MPQTNVSVIIPTLNAGTMIDDLLTSLEHQRRVPDEIIVVDSSSDDDTRDLVRRHPEVRLIVIDRKDFNHGGTRDMALRESSGDFVLFLTQDALPESDQYIDAVLAPFKQGVSRSSTAVRYHAPMRARRRRSSGNSPMGRVPSPLRRRTCGVWASTRSVPPTSAPPTGAPRILR